MALDLKIVVRDNVRRLLKLPDGKPGISELAKKAGLTNGTAQRIMEAETSLGVDMLAKIADALGVEPWQLCIPGLDPERLPGIEPATRRWPFRQVDEDVITGLSGSPAAAVENGLLVALASAGVSPRKPGRRAA